MRPHQRLERGRAVPIQLLGAAVFKHNFLVDTFRHLPAPFLSAAETPLTQTPSLSSFCGELCLCNPIPFRKNPIIPPQRSPSRKIPGHRVDDREKIKLTQLFPPRQSMKLFELQKNSRKRAMINLFLCENYVARSVFLPFPAKLL